MIRIMNYPGFLLWENSMFTIHTPKNPHIPFAEGLQIVVAPKQKVDNAWQDIDLSTETFNLAAKACAVMEDLKLAPWFNIQANGNWGLLPGAKPFFHIHIYGRNKTANWGNPIVLPKLPNTYSNEPMPTEVRHKLKITFYNSFSA